MSGCYRDEVRSGMPVRVDTGGHVWRMYERIQVPAFGRRVVGYREVWYCTLCRLVDERITEVNPDEAA